MMQTNIQNIYIDTYYFQGYLWGKKDKEEDARDIFSRIETRSRRHPDINVKIPFVVVGELINNLNRGNFEQRDKSDIMHNFFELLEKLKADIIPPNKCCYAKAKLLIQRDPHLVENAPTDTFIALCALCDPYSAFLLFHDRLVLESYPSCTDIILTMRSFSKKFK